MADGKAVRPVRTDGATWELVVKAEDDAHETTITYGGMDKCPTRDEIAEASDNITDTFQCFFELEGTLRVSHMVLKVIPGSIARERRARVLGAGA